MTSNPGAAIAFYSKVAGWGTMPWNGPMPYTMWTVGEAPIGGVNDLPPDAKAAGAPPHWLAYVAVPDINATVKRVGELGGKVKVPPTEIPEIGRFAVIADPQGAVIALYTSATESPAPEGPPQKGHFSWHELATTDNVKAFAFYSDLFGWEKTDAMDMGPMGVYQMYGAGGVPYGGMYNKPPEMPAPPHWLYYFVVDDANASVEVIKGLGGQVLNGPMEVPGGDLIAQCLDPQGAAFAIHSKKKA
jgi:predicted enzyme related to lactoylglutathione lyase